jgi:septal ring factor EnvC (AmiA/AmiB activator)
MPENVRLEIVEKYVMKGIVALAGLSLAINSYLVKEKVAEINLNIKELSISMQKVQISQAVLQSQVDRHEQRLSTHHDRLQHVEKTSERISAYLDAREGKRSSN